MRRLRWFSTVITLIAMPFGPAQTARAAESARAAPLRVASSAISVNQAIPWIAHDAGHFKKHGLEVELIHASSITALRALPAGEVSIAQSATDAYVSSRPSASCAACSKA